MLHLITNHFLFKEAFNRFMLIQVILTIWLLALIFLTRKFRKENRLPQQRIFSIFLIIWSCLSIIYYDVWTFTSGILEQTTAPWWIYLPVMFFSVCAGLGTYYLMMTFGKFREFQQKKLGKSNNDNNKSSNKKNSTANKKSSKKK